MTDTPNLFKWEVQYAVICLQCAAKYIVCSAQFALCNLIHFFRQSQGNIAAVILTLFTCLQLSCDHVILTLFTCSQLPRHRLDAGTFGTMGLGPGFAIATALYARKYDPGK